MKPLPIDKLTLELISPKRDIAQLSVNQGSKKSRVRAVIEYRGDALILARTYGDCDIEQVAETLTLIYLKRYGRKAFGEIIGRRKEGKVCDTTLEDPHHFSKFLHLIHTLGELEDPLPRPAEFERSPGLKSKEDSLENRVRLAERVYTPLRKEILGWNDPLRAIFSVWESLQLEERMWVMKVPRPISILLGEAKELFDRKSDLRRLLHDFVNESTLYFLRRLGLTSVQDLGTVEFRLVVEPGGYDRILVSWIWELETDLSNYIMDFVQSNFASKTVWKLETWIYLSKGAPGTLIGGDRETRRVINGVLRGLMTKRFARDLQSTNRQIEELGSRILSLIDDQLRAN